MPAFVMKRMILAGFPKNTLDESIAESIDFMVNRVSSLTSL